MAGNFSDLLIIRLFLSSAYIFLFTNSLLGGPIWPLWRIPNHIQLDGVFWAVLNLYVHVSTVVRLLLDERPVVLKNEALWRLFYRTGGLSKKLFQKSIDPYCEMVTFHRNDVIPIDDKYGNREWFYIIYKGRVTLKVVGIEDQVQEDDGNKERRKIIGSTTRIAQSAQLFDFRSLGFLKDAPIAQNQQNRHKLHSAKAFSETVVLFRFPAKLMDTKIACDPTTRLMWKELLMENLLRIVQRHFYKVKREHVESKHATGTGQTSVEGDGVNPAFWPLEKFEEPEALRAGSGEAWKTPIRHIFKSMQWSFTPPWPFKGFPVGLRHKVYLYAPSQPAATDNTAGECMESGKQNGVKSVDEENQSLLRSDVDSSDGYNSIESFRSESDEDFLCYLDELDESTGMGLKISFLASSQHGSEYSEL